MRNMILWQNKMSGILLTITASLDGVKEPLSLIVEFKWKGVSFPFFYNVEPARMNEWDEGRLELLFLPQARQIDVLELIARCYCNANNGYQKQCLNKPGTNLLNSQP